ncbi:DEHA2A12078p [Debaryomyces hansenii CBS767]|uniref:tRNA wybutosine-synthesizing protein 3 n=1 Tax=Debaryomyces hansenii (strain ATCC 36239 / CBS 767 / BCRC 21394 / JCM 1990 / NBRC 0083 / IGC 2968) TaxID=284592 RepID=Q6BY64_DEBHA|nr:DEHA2A12078p [Debaryomyces hansenii CBS767]CAG84830.1 DEHA2A12078p [Debaryomyces hansenii CBS767]|eukprot:XP_456855.1 DEHA2A12078p [Debaryomyces hansenii CBS767]
MQDPFDQKKKSILAEIGATDEITPDASPKGTIDEFCIPIIHLINSNKDMVTTSSCSGRVSVFLEGMKNIDQDDIKIGAKGNYGRWIFVTHDPKDLPDWSSSVNFKYITDGSSYGSTDVNARYILYKFEPLILHVKCRDLEMANNLYSVAMSCGFRESGIGTNNIVGIRISIKLDVPIGFLNETNQELTSFVSEDYLRIITKLSEDRFKENFKKLDALYKAIESLNTLKSPISKVETKEERKSRKMKEGLARREEVRALKEQKKKEKLSSEQQEKHHEQKQ